MYQMLVIVWRIAAIFCMISGRKIPPLLERTCLKTPTSRYSLLIFAQLEMSIRLILETQVTGTNAYRRSTQLWPITAATTQSVNGLMLVGLDRSRGSILLGRMKRYKKNMQKMQFDLVEDVWTCPNMESVYLSENWWSDSTPNTLINLPIWHAAIHAKPSLVSWPNI